jgi:hypothetical protein
MANIIKPSYAASGTITATLASLASDANLLAGRSSILVDNTSVLAAEYLLAGRIKAGTSPTAGVLEVHVIGIQDDTVWPDVVDGTDSNKTLTSAAIKQGICRPVASFTTDTTTGRVYPFGPIAVGNRCFGGWLPKKFVVFVVHSMVAALDATGGNHVLDITALQLQFV